MTKIYKPRTTRIEMSPVFQKYFKKYTKGCRNTSLRRLMFLVLVSLYKGRVSIDETMNILGVSRACAVDYITICNSIFEATKNQFKEGNKQ